MSLRQLSVLVFLSLWTASVQAQETHPVYDPECRATAQSAIAVAIDNCSGLEANTLCYGSGLVTITAQDSATLPDEIEPGTTVSASVVDTVTAVPFLAEIGNYAVVRFAPRPDAAAPPVNAILLGEAILTNTSSAPDDFGVLTLTVATREGAIMRTQPDANAAVLTPVLRGTAVTATGMSQDRAWLRVRGPEGAIGWISTTLFDDDLSALPLVDADADVAAYGPLQSLLLQTGLDDAACTGIIDSGLLLQTRDTAIPVLFEINGLPLLFDGTVFVQASTETLEMRVSVLEGTVTLNGADTLTVGEMARLELDDTGLFSAYDGTVEDYAYFKLRYVPAPLLARIPELPFSLGGLVTPWPSENNPFEGASLDGPCVVAWNAAVNLRTGPGTDYRIRQGVPGFYRAPVDARATGTDELVWWRLAEAIWINAEITSFAGSCDSLPWIDPPPSD